LQTKYIGLILGVLVLVISISGCVNSNTKVNMVNNTYTGEGVSFNIPNDWQVSKITDGSTTNIDITNNNRVDGLIANIARTSSVNSNSNIDNTQITVDISPIPKGMSSQYAVNIIQNPQNQGDYQKISNNTITVDGSIAYENIYIVNDSNRFNQTMKEQQINFIKNGTTYGLVFDAPVQSFDQEISNFNIILNGFKVL
jgi:hypothetical protein